MDEFEEATRLAVLRSVLVEEGELGFVELAKELVPTDRLQGVVALIELDSQNAGILAAPVPHGRRFALPRFDPAANLVVIEGDLAFAHDGAPSRAHFLAT